MRIENTITRLWRTLSADSRRGAVARRRAVAMGAMAAFMLALLAAIGFLWFVLLLLAAVAIVVNAVAGAMLLRRYLPHVRAPHVDVRAAGLRLGHSTARASGNARRVGLLLGGRVAVGAERTARELRAATATVGTATTRVRAASERRPEQATAAPNLQRDAVRANAAGSQLRRAGAYAEAAEEHRLALDLYRSLGDRRGEALTLNNLALALDRAGDPSGLELFEEAATILGELGEEEREGQVIANLALAFRRRGREEQSGEVLDVALGKLNPESREYRKLEELRRAS